MYAHDERRAGITTRCSSYDAVINDRSKRFGVRVRGILGVRWKIAAKPGALVEVGCEAECKRIEDRH